MLNTCTELHKAVAREPNDEAAVGALADWYRENGRPEQAELVLARWRIDRIDWFLMAHYDRKKGKWIAYKRWPRKKSGFRCRDDAVAEKRRLEERAKKLEGLLELMAAIDVMQDALFKRDNGLPQPEGYVAALAAHPPFNMR